MAMASCSLQRRRLPVWSYFNIRQMACFCWTLLLPVSNKSFFPVIVLILLYMYIIFYFFQCSRRLLGCQTWSSKKRNYIPFTIWTIETHFIHNTSSWIHWQWIHQWYCFIENDWIYLFQWLCKTNMSSTSRIWYWW